jgi:NhaP-type Na+/H+ or K+/H+ antiporter
MPHLTEILALLVVPVLGIVRPSEALGDAFQPLVRLAVAVIPFEGGLTLRWSELRQAGGGVMRLITLTLLLSWLLGVGAAHWIAGLSWPPSSWCGSTGEAPRSWPR